MFLREIICTLLNSAYLHDLSPFAIKFSETAGIRWYGLSYLAGFFCAYLIILHLSRKGTIKIQPAQVSDFIFYSAAGAILGGRLGYCLFYDTSLLTKFTSNFPFWGVLEIHKGGMASHGGILGVIAACLIFAKKEILPKLELLDLVAITACLGIMFGRIANFVNGELVGRPCQESYIFAVKFPQDLFNWNPANQDDVRNYAALAEALGFNEAYLMEAVRSGNNRLSDQIASRTIDQIQKGNLIIREKAAKVLIARHPSQLYQAILEGLLLFLIILIVRIFWKMSGLSSSIFVIFYPVARIIGEQFRLPDAQIGYQLFDLTRGQWISIFMMLAGITYSIFIFCFNSTKKSGEIE